MNSIIPRLKLPEGCKERYDTLKQALNDVRASSRFNMPGVDEHVYREFMHDLAGLITCMEVGVMYPKRETVDRVLAEHPARLQALFYKAELQLDALPPELAEKIANIKRGLENTLDDLREARGEMRFADAQAWKARDYRIAELWEELKPSMRRIRKEHPEVIRDHVPLPEADGINRLEDMVAMARTVLDNLPNQLTPEAYDRLAQMMDPENLRIFSQARAIFEHCEPNKDQLRTLDDLEWAMRETFEAAAGKEKADEVRQSWGEYTVMRREERDKLQGAFKS